MSKRKQPYRYGVPAKYVEGLSPSAAKKKAAEIKRTAEAYKKGQYIDIKAVSKSRTKQDGSKKKTTVRSRRKKSKS